MAWLGEQAILAFVFSPFGVWNDRNTVLHGTSLDHSKIPFGEYVSTDYHRFSRENDGVMNAYFDTPIEDKLRAPIIRLRYWLERVEESWSCQDLVQQAKDRIKCLRWEHHFVNTSVLYLLNKDYETNPTRVRTSSSSRPSLIAFSLIKTNTFFPFSFLFICNSL